MSDPFLRAFLHQCSGHAEAVFHPDKPGRDMETEMLAHIVAEGHDGKVSVFVCPMGPEDERMFRIGLPASFRVSRKYRHWCFFSKAWSAERDAREVNGPLPVNAPNRIEVVVFYAENVAGERLSATRQIFRFPGRPARLLPLVFSELRTEFVMEGQGR